MSSSMTDARHGHRQTSMETTNSVPLRKVDSSFVDDLDRDCDNLECGHVVVAPTDFTGIARAAGRRRCNQCAKANDD